MAPCSRVPGPFHMGTCNNGILFDRYLTGGRKSGPGKGVRTPVHGAIVVRVFI